MRLVTRLMIACLLLTATQASIFKSVQSFGKWVVGSYEPLPTVEKVKLSKLKGLWSEIFRLPNNYESCEEGCMSINYEISANKTLEVTTTCVSNDKHAALSETTAFAKPRNANNTQFDLCLNNTKNCGDFQFIAFDKNYRWALIGSNDRESLWAIARESNLDPDIIEFLIEKAKDLKFNTNRLVYQMEKCLSRRKFLFLDENIVDDIFKFFHLA